MKYLKNDSSEGRIIVPKGTEVLPSCVAASVSYAAKKDYSSTSDLWVNCWLDYYVAVSCKDVVKETHLYCCEDDKVECTDGKWYLKEDTLMRKVGGKT